MPSLIHQQTNQTLALDVKKAESLLERFKGLAGKENIPNQSAFWLPACPSIHTFFMKFPLDIIFTDRKFRVVSFHHAIPPGRIIFGGWKSYHTFEMKPLELKHFTIQRGDKLHVVC